MEAKEKAIELVEKYRNVRWDIDPDTAKQCALIAVDEILNVILDIFETYEERNFWIEVKIEIEKL